MLKTNGIWITSSLYTFLGCACNDVGVKYVILETAEKCVTCDSEWKYWFELLFWWILLGLLIIIVKYYMNLTIIMWHLSNIWHHDQFDLFSWIIIELSNNWNMQRAVVQCVFYFFFENWNNELLYLIVILPGSNYKNLKNFCFCHHILHIDSILLLRVPMGLSVSLNKDLVIW